MLGRGGGGVNYGVCGQSAEEYLAGVCGLVGEHLDAIVVGEAGVI